MTEGEFEYDRGPSGTTGLKISNREGPTSTTCFPYVIPDICYRESMTFESIVVSGYPIKAFGYDRGTRAQQGRFGYDGRDIEERKYGIGS